MKIRSGKSGWLATVAVVGAVAAAVIIPTTAASAAPATAAAATAPAAASASGNARGESRLTADALSAGRAKAGAKATTQDALSSYWTKARMKAAIPADQSPKFQADAKAYNARVAADAKAGRKPVTNDGPRRSFAGTTGKLAKDAKGAGKAMKSQFKMPTADGLSAGYVYNPNFLYYTPAAYTQGKVFFTMNGLGYVCSASIVNSEGADQVWTAGHCVHGGSGGSWAYNWTFVPAYDDDLSNPAPYGYWTASYLTSRTAWTNSSDFSQDFGVAVMNTNFGGWHIVNYFGGQGLTVNRGKSGTWEYAFGYTSYGSYDGGNVLGCYGYTSPEWDYWITWSQTVQFGCGLNRGASGGPWWTDWNGSWGYLNGVNSRVDSYASPTVIRSGYFDDDAMSLYNYNRYA